MKISFLLVLSLAGLTSLSALVPNEAFAQASGQNRKGKVNFVFGIDLQIGRELAIREPSMCDGHAEAEVAWDRRKNKVVVHAKFDGLPYRPHFKYDYDPSTPYNLYPLEVQDGRWQMWILGRMFTRTSVFYYDPNTGDLLGNEFDLPGPDPSWIAVDLPVAHLLCTDFFESKPSNLKANVKFSFAYDGLIDAAGKGGVFSTVLPTNLLTQDDYSTWDIYYTNGGLPVSEAMNWDNVVDDIEVAELGGPGGLILATSYEPFPKPDYLKSRDNLMLGWGGQYPLGIFPLNVPPEEFKDCGTFQLPGDFSNFFPQE